MCNLINFTVKFSFSLNNFGLAKKVVGIDIGTSSVKIVEAEKKKNINHLTNYGYFYNPDKESSFYFNSLKVDHGYIADVIKNILTQSKIESNNVMMSIPVASSFSTIIKLPVMKNSKEIETAIGFEASRSIPLPLKDLRLEWHLLDHLSDNKTIKVLISAVPNDIVDKYSKIAKLLKIKNFKSEIDSVSLSRVFSMPDISKQDEKKQFDKSSFAVVDMGQNHTGISIIDQGIVCSYNASKISGNVCAMKIAEMMSVSRDRAHRIMSEEGFNANSNINDSIKVNIDKLINEVSKSNELYVSHGGANIKRIVLTGGLKNIPGIVDYLSQNLKVPVVKGEQYKKIGVQKELSPVLDKQEVDLSVAIGLIS